MTVVAAQLQYAWGQAIGNLDGVAGVSWEEKERAEGGGRLTVPVGHPLAGELTRPDRIVSVAVDGTPVWEWLTRPISRKLADEQGGMIDVAGPGVRALLDAAKVYAIGGCTLDEQRERTIGYPDPAFDASGLPNVASAGTVASDPFDTPRPEDWPDPIMHARYIGAGVGNVAPGDVLLFSPFFTLASGEDMLLHVSADDEYDVWVNGMRIGQSRGPYRWRGFDVYPLLMCPGTYRIVMRIHNLDRTEATGQPDSPLWGLCALTTATGAGEIDAVTLVSDLSWRAYAYPSGMVGLTPGHAVRLLLAEAQARGDTKLDYVTLGFTDTHDSAGVAWGQQVEIPVEVARTSFGEVVTAIERLGFDVRMSPGRVLDMWVQRGQDRTADVAVTRLGSGSVWRRDNEIANVLLSEGEDRPVETADAASVAAEGRYEAFYALEAHNDAALRDRQRTGLEDTVHGYEEATFQIADEDGPNPYEHYVWGDVVSGPDLVGAAASQRVAGWRADVDDDNGAVVWNVSAVKQ